MRVVAAKKITVSSVIMFLKSKFNNFFRKIESNDDSHSNGCIAMYKEGDVIFTFPETPKEPSLYRTKG